MLATPLIAVSALPHLSSTRAGIAGVRSAGLKLQERKLRAKKTMMLSTSWILGEPTAHNMPIQEKVATSQAAGGNLRRVSTGADKGSPGMDTEVVGAWTMAGAVAESNGMVERQDGTKTIKAHQNGAKTTAWRNGGKTMAGPRVKAVQDGVKIRVVQGGVRIKTRRDEVMIKAGRHMTRAMSGMIHSTIRTLTGGKTKARVGMN
jgi:hypothetical protein